MVDQIRPIGADDATHDDERDASADGARHEQHATADLVNPEQRGQRAEGVDNSVHAGCQEGRL